MKTVAEPVLNHRLILNHQARFDRMTPSRLVKELLAQLDETGLKLPATAAAVPEKPASGDSNLDALRKARERADRRTGRNP